MALKSSFVNFLTKVGMFVVWIIYWRNCDFARLRYHSQATRKWTTSECTYRWKRWRCKQFGFQPGRCSEDASNHPSNCKGDRHSPFVGVSHCSKRSSVEMFEEAPRAQELTVTNCASRLTRAKKLLRRFPASAVDFIFFTDEKIFTAGESVSDTDTWCGWSEATPDCIVVWYAAISHWQGHWPVAYGCGPVWKLTDDTLSTCSDCLDLFLHVLFAFSSWFLLTLPLDFGVYHCEYHSFLLLVLQGTVGAQKIGVVGNTMQVLLQFSSGVSLPKIIKISRGPTKLLQK